MASRPKSAAATQDASTPANEPAPPEHGKSGHQRATTPRARATQGSSSPQSAGAKATPGRSDGGQRTEPGPSRGQQGWDGVFGVVVGDVTSDAELEGRGGLAPERAALEVSPALVRFGSVPVGTSAEMDVMVRNPHPVALVFAGLGEINGTDAEFFIDRPPDGSVIAPNESFAITVRFQPMKTGRRGIQATLGSTLAAGSGALQRWAKGSNGCSTTSTYSDRPR